jgi:hypothetical protein
MVPAAHRGIDGSLPCDRNLVVSGPVGLAGREVCDRGLRSHSLVSRQRLIARDAQRFG